MRLICDTSLAGEKTSSSQRTRLITEGWFTSEGYCLNCTSSRLQSTPPGTAFCDHICPKCQQGYELKSAARAHTRIVQDGGYDSMMRQIQAESPPALMLMHYTSEWYVRGLVAVHPVFMTSAVIMKRKRPHLRPKTKQEYWMCDFDLSLIPADGKIALVSDGKIMPTRMARRAFRESLRFTDIPLKKRGWAAQVLAVVRKIGKQEFTLAEVYAYEEELQAAHPENSHVREKIRQQLQALRDLGYIEFGKPGEYRMLL